MNSVTHYPRLQGKEEGKDLKVIIEKFYRPAMLWKLKITDFIKANWLLITILLIGSFLRLYKISAYMTFLGDEGRDVLVVRNLLVHFDPILIGPGTSVGNMYLGPLYYYFMAPFLLLSGFSPVGPAVELHFGSYNDLFNLPRRI